MTETTMRHPQARGDAAGGPDASPGRRERNKREKLARIVAAARTLFHKQGFAATTTQEIAYLADIGSGTLFLYAKSKEDLLILVFKDEILEIVDRAYASCPKTASVIDQVMHILNAFIAYHKQDLALASALIKEITLVTNAERRVDVNVLMNRIYGRLGAIVERAQRVGSVRADVDPQAAARNLFATYYMGLLGWLGGYASYAEFRTTLEPVLKLQMHGLAATRTTKRRAAKPRAPRGATRS
jgi:AcrR family transcriptional regulator